MAAIPAIVGKSIVIERHPYTVVGIAPIEFTGVDLDATDVWLPANTYEGMAGGEPWYETFQNSFRLIARVPDVGVEQRMTTLGTSALRTVHLRDWGYDSTVTLLAGSIMRASGPARGDQEIAISTRLAGVALIVLAHRLRQRRQPAARARYAPAARDRGTTSARRVHGATL